MLVGTRESKGSYFQTLLDGIYVLVDRMSGKGLNSRLKRSRGPIGTYSHAPTNFILSAHPRGPGWGIMISE